MEHKDVAVCTTILGEDEELKARFNELAQLAKDDIDEQLSTPEMATPQKMDHRNRLLAQREIVVEEQARVSLIKSTGTNDPNIALSTIDGAERLVSLLYYPLGMRATMDWPVLILYEMAWSGTGAPWMRRRRRDIYPCLSTRRG